MTDVWQYLKKTEKPIVLYGTGNGGDKVISRLEEEGITVSGIFASDGFVRERTFHGIKVESYKNIISRLGNDVIILIVFGSSRPEVLEIFAKLGALHEVIVPDMPVCGENTWDGDFYGKNAEKIAAVRELFADEESKLVFDNIVEYRNTGALKNLFEHITEPCEVFSHVLRPDEYKITADLGAYNGDTAIELLSYCKNVDTVIAVEPDEKNFAKLCLNTHASGKVEAHNCAAWDRPDVLSFSKGGGRAIRTGNAKTVEVRALPLDMLVAGRKVDYIKYDVEGEEKKALIGSFETIERCRPDLQIALYHRPEDIFEIPLMINNTFPSYRLYLRRYLSVPGWDINLFAVGGRND